MNATDNFKSTIQAYLEQRAEFDELFAVSFAKAHKSIDDCITYILNWVQKSGCIGFCDAEIFSQAVRNGYKITDGSMWCDYIDLLQHFGKDTNSPKYVCPKNLTAQHDCLVKRREQQRAEERAETKRLKALENEEQFKELKAKFFGLMFTDGALQVRVLESVLEHINEGEAMHHCVGQYHSKAKSLILSATIDGERIATVEISLDTLKVVQCRGVCNAQVEEQPQIIKLIDKNINQIANRLAA